MGFYYARHGQPMFPYGDDYHRNNNLPLSFDGISQAADLGRSLVHSGITRIITSEYPRAIQTGSKAAEIIGVTKFVQTKLLNEVHHGNFDHQNFRTWLATGVGNSDQVEVPAESVAEVRHRLREFLTQYSPNEQTLVVAHGLLYSVLLLEAAKLPDDTPVLANPTNLELGYAQCEFVDFNQI